MKLKVVLASCLFVGSVASLPLSVQAKATAEQIASLNGPKTTCVGAEKAGTKSGVAEYTGKYLDSWPGMKGKSGYEPGPYADEKPILKITSTNAAQYADKLTDGQKAMLKKYPSTFYMNIYPSHRDFRQPDWVCEVIKKNAASSEVIHDGLGITGITGGTPFPFPTTGLEAIWNTNGTYRPWNENAVVDIADVYASGNIAWGKQHFMSFALANDPKKRGSFQDKINAYFFTAYYLPERDKGFVAVGFQPNDFTKDSTQSWQYQPGIRRVRQAPEVGFDYPVPPAGLRTVDDDYGFNGSPERYSWKLIGKKELYVPYNNFKVNDTSVKYKDLIKPNNVNPEYLRYEMHRVWVLEGNLKPGVRHIYKRRVLYIDEDTWLTLAADNYDARGQLWRTTTITYHYSQQSQSYHRGASIYNDLTANAYEAGYLSNEAGDKWWDLNSTKITPAMFSPDAAARGGH